jgi:hypothetical protein
MVLERPTDVIVEASRLGFLLEETIDEGVIVWAWRRGIDRDWPYFLRRRDALEWMKDRLRSGTQFER